MYQAHTRVDAPVPWALDKNWIGDEVTPNCIFMAIVNHLLRTKGILVTEEEIQELTEACEECPEPTIEDVLWTAWLIGWPGGRIRLGNYRRVHGEAMQAPLLVIGYEVSQGDHAGLSLEEGKVVSWGTVNVREAPVEEAWELLWES
jgi:hypothetical protein